MQLVTYEKGKHYNLNLNEIHPDPEQPRKYFDEQALNELFNHYGRQIIPLGQTRSIAFPSPASTGNRSGN